MCVTSSIRRDRSICQCLQRHAPVTRRLTDGHGAVYHRERDLLNFVRLSRSVLIGLSPKDALSLFRMVSGNRRKVSCLSPPLHVMPTLYMVVHTCIHMLIYTHQARRKQYKCGQAGMGWWGVGNLPCAFAPRGLRGAPLDPRR